MFFLGTKEESGLEEDMVEEEDGRRLEEEDEGIKFKGIIDENENTEKVLACPVSYSDNQRTNVDIKKRGFNLK